MAPATTTPTSPAIGEEPRRFVATLDGYWYLINHYGDTDDAKLLAMLDNLGTRTAVARECARAISLVSTRPDAASQYARIAADLDRTTIELLLRGLLCTPCAAVGDGPSRSREPEGVTRFAATLAGAQFAAANGDTDDGQLLIVLHDQGTRGSALREFGLTASLISALPEVAEQHGRIAASLDHMIVELIERGLLTAVSGAQ